MKKLLIFMFSVTWILIIYSSIFKIEKYENLITGLLIFDIFYIGLIVIFYSKKNQNEKN